MIDSASVLAGDVIEITTPGGISIFRTISHCHPRTGGSIAIETLLPQKQTQRKGNHKTSQQNSPIPNQLVMV